MHPKLNRKDAFIMRKHLKRLTRRFTGAALASVMMLSGSLPVYAHWDYGGDNDITSSDDVVDSGSSGGSGYDYTDVDPYDVMISDIIEKGKDPDIDYREFCEPGGTYYEPHVKLKHQEISGDELPGGEIPFRPYVTEMELGGDWEDYVFITDSILPGEGVDTIEVVDLSHSDESYTEEGYLIFRPDMSKFTVNHHIDSDSYKAGWDNGGTMDIYIPWFIPRGRRDTVVYERPFKEYCNDTEETIVIDSKTALLHVEKNCVQVEGRTGRFQAVLTDARTGKFITAETLVLKDPNGTPTVTFSGLPDGEYKVTWSAEHTARWYTRQKWYTEIFAYAKETRRQILAYTSYWERKDDWEYSNSYWVEDEIKSYTFNSKNGGDITIGDGGEVSNWVFIK